MVTVFKNFNEVVEHKSLLTILEEIKTGKYKHAIVYLRKSLSEKKLEAYEKAKKSLPAFTPSAKFVGGVNWNTWRNIQIVSFWTSTN